MLTAIVVDDEKMTRETLYHSIPWDALGFTTVQQASNGLVALELAEQTRPDLVLSDIRMPKMNGIELGRELRARYPDCKIIFLSAYADKEYFKSAIKLSAVDYIEKPIVLPDIIKLVDSTASRCHEEKKRQRENDAYAQQKRAVTLCKPGDAVSLNEDVSFPPFGHYRTVLFQYKNNVQAMHRDMVAFHLNKEHRKAIVGLYDENHIVAHIVMAHDEPLHTLSSTLEKYLQASHSHGLHVHISIGNAVQGLQEVHNSYAQAVELSASLFYSGYGQIISGSDRPLGVYQFHDNMTDTFYKLFKERQKKEAIEKIASLMNEIRFCSGTPVNYIKNGFFNIVLKMNRFLEERHLIPEDTGSHALNENKFVWEVISSLSTLEELGEYLQHYMQTIFEQLDNENNQIHTAYKIKSYIERHAHDSNLSIQSISQHFFLSTNYTSFIFKKECKITINQYVTAVRMNKAKALLADNKLTLIEIAAQVGYSDAKYFARVFKKEVGLTTSEYRERFIR